MNERYSTKGWEQLFPERFRKYKKVFGKINSLFYTYDSFIEDMIKKDEYTRPKRIEELMYVLERLKYSKNYPTISRGLFCLMSCDKEDWRTTGFFHKTIDSTSSTILPIMHYFERCNLVEKLRLDSKKPYFGSYAWRLLPWGVRIREDILSDIDKTAKNHGFDKIKEDLMLFRDERIIMTLKDSGCYIGIKDSKHRVYAYPELDKIAEKTDEEHIFHLSHRRTKESTQYLNI